MLLFKKLVDITEISTTPEATSYHSSRKFSIFLLLRPIQNLSFHYETPCSKRPNHVEYFFQILCASQKVRTLSIYLQNSLNAKTYLHTLPLTTDGKKLRNIATTFSYNIKMKNGMYFVSELFQTHWRKKRRICKKFKIVKTIYLSIESSVQFLKQNTFSTCSWKFLRSNELEQLYFKLKRIFGIQKPTGQVRKRTFLPG